MTVGNFATLRTGIATMLSKSAGAVPIVGAPLQLAHYREIWLFDFEFVLARRAARSALPGRPRNPLGSHDQALRRRIARAPHATLFDRAGRSVRGLLRLGRTGPRSRMGWPLPTRTLDLFAEFRNQTSGLNPPHGNGLIGRCSGTAWMPWAPPRKNRCVIWSWAAARTPTMNEKRSSIIARRMSCIGPAPARQIYIDLPRALLRGMHMAPAGLIESVGVPIDVEILNLLLGCWEDLRTD